MVFNSLIILRIAHVSANLWQYAARIEDRISSSQLLDLICCFPLQQLGRFTLFVWTFLCVPPTDPYYTFSYSSSSSSSSSSDSDESSSTPDLVHYQDYEESHSD